MLRNKKEKGLLYVSAGIFSCTSIVYVILTYFYPQLISSPKKFGDFDNIFWVIASTLIIAPIVEELVFRGVFLKRLIFSFFFYSGSIILCIISENYYLIILLIIFLYFQLIKIKQKEIFYAINTLLFALIHYNINDFVNVYSFIPIFFQFSLGLFFIWITLNYGLKWSITIHFFVNFIIITPIIFLLQFPTKHQQTIQIRDSNFIWQKTTLIGPSKVFFSTQKVEAQRITINQFISLFHNDSLNLTVNDSLRFYRFNFKLENKNSNIKSDELKNVLLSSKLVEEKKK